ncbi:MAG: ABC transporter substrate-binding protein [Alphaproteobacteria bacterium]|jgi:branched-chain amino acid transport system substrate-binding protein|nr:ABC transporter substrate-binding protein [Alphaproteobacteria bacterium]
MRILFGLALALIAGLPAPAGAGDPIRIGVVLPFSGVYAALGGDITDGMMLAFETFGDTVAGRRIELIREDSEVKPSVGLTKTKKLVYQDQVDLLVGPVASNVAGAMRDFVHNAEIPLIVPNAGNNLLTGERCSPWVIRTSFSNDQINRGMGGWLFDKGYRSLYLLAADYAAGHQMMAAVKRSFTAAGGAIVGEEYPPLRETKDFAPYLAKIKAAKPDAMYVFFAGGPAIQFVKQVHDFGLKKEIALTGAGWLTSPLFLPAEGAAAVGFTGALNYVPSIDSDENRQFQNAFQEKHGRVGSEFTVQGYDTARLIVEALEITGGATDDKAALVAAMHQVSFTGPRGPLRIDPATNNVIQDIYVFETRQVGYAVKQVVIDKMEAVQDPPNGCRMEVGRG